ncbi:hypothetical protein A2303_01525 [Candidatus Falkowbacteria bacterium RIFOXYB2_FULL_47_14]|uniref:Glycosyltransferase 2-like domain-containing protein n=1 Tax=Candidatus Falkowbacteria bacterium RIFOXYA2_FULL_47_19 TaxID=1797994 RepID=A0A1F5SLF1_9BACT|nr:MAG: hypothetical protein A2227_01600 [Candidatus Falkowbacteria bacterium RIFOXYA2_FULL_47_19]OGF34775.1 MAG: hypothetical protein A2468_03490 [Candidatus Falkowbacteria bacterium RIFOXYC2_FULL_46_15]OGF43465.1 MAG: hypothetical protein A2303_01525 [Candidatus Falkowbacteria bacterium RIFOXYB2_FULL_47_14]
MELIVSFILLIGFNLTAWTIIGLIRFFLEKLKIEKTPRTMIAPDFLALMENRAFEAGGITADDVAAIIPAHNEAKTIAKTVNSLKRILPASHIYVANDASVDRTSDIAKRLNCQVFDAYPNMGKANVIVHTIKLLRLTRYYKAIMIIDADSEVNEEYLRKALPFFDDPNVVAVAPHAETKWDRHHPLDWSLLFTAYRVRVYRILQAVLRYGQTWTYTNVTMIIPGFACLYRSTAIEKININPAGLVIEDYNMTFEVHHKKLGKIAYSPQIKGFTQDPGNLRDYYKQVKRWNLGFWQTWRRHRIWPSLFSLTTLLYAGEVLISSFLFLLSPILLGWFALNSFLPFYLPFKIPFMDATQINFLDMMASLFLIDYLLTVITAWYEKKPVLLLYGPAFFILRYLDAFVLLYTLPLAFIIRSDGRWKSPTRSPA